MSIACSKVREVLKIEQSLEDIHVVGGWQRHIVEGAEGQHLEVGEFRCRVREWVQEFIFRLAIRFVKRNWNLQP